MNSNARKHRCSFYTALLVIVFASSPVYASSEPNLSDTLNFLNAHFNQDDPYPLLKEPMAEIEYRSENQKSLVIRYTERLGVNNIRIDAAKINLDSIKVQKFGRGSGFYFSLGCKGDHGCIRERWDDGSGQTVSHIRVKNIQSTFEPERFRNAIVHVLQLLGANDDPSPTLFE